MDGWIYTSNHSITFLAIGGFNDIAFYNQPYYNAAHINAERMHPNELMSRWGLLLPHMNECCFSSMGTWRHNWRGRGERTDMRRLTLNITINDINSTSKATIAYSFVCATIWLKELII